MRQGIAGFRSFSFWLGHMTASAEKQQPHLVVDSERPGAGVGAILRGARLARDEDLREVASALRIRLPYLQALEDGDVSALPGVTYGIGFVRAYAAYLDLNVEETVARFKSEVSGVHRRTQLSFPEPLPGNRVPGGALLLIVLILAGAVYGGWLYTSSQNMSFTEAVEQVPQRLMALLKQEDETAPEAADASMTDPASTVDPMTEQPVTEQPPADTAAQETPDQETPAIAEPPSDVEAASDESAPQAEAEPAPDAETAMAPTTSAPTTSTPAEETTAPETPTAEAQVAEPVPTTPEAPVAETPPSEAPTAAAEATPEPSAEPNAESESVITVEELPNPPAAPEPPTASPPATEAEGTEQAAAPAAETAEPEAPVPAPTAAEETASESTPTADAAAPPTTAPEATAEPTTPSRIIVQATSDSWIQVTDASGSVVYERLMLTGDIYRVPDRDGLKLTTGNAGALKIVVDGTTISPIGESGEVRRDIALTPDALKP